MLWCHHHDRPTTILPLFSISSIRAADDCSASWRPVSIFSLLFFRYLKTLLTFVVTTWYLLLRVCRWRCVNGARTLFNLLTLPLIVLCVRWLLLAAAAACPVEFFSFHFCFRNSSDAHTTQQKNSLALSDNLIADRALYILYKKLRRDMRLTQQRRRNNFTTTTKQSQKKVLQK